MTSEERRKARYRRRKNARIERRKRKFPDVDNFTSVFSFYNLWESYLNCRKNVRWKGSVQRYVFTAPIKVYRTYKQLHSGKYKHVTPNEWDTYERGTLRHIKSVPIGERVVQRCLADNCLVPLLSNTFIYDNGACLKDKGYTFAISRLETHLHRHYRKYGNEGYILNFDFSKFYQRVDHNLLRFILGKYLTDCKIKKMIDTILAASGEGLGLGSQISQILALTSANGLDHQAKEIMRIKGYARYNDDGYLIHHSKKYLQKCLKYMEKLCSILNITLNKKKTHIVKLSHGFKFLKVRFFLTETGKVVKKIGKRGITRERQKLKKLKKKMLNGMMDWKHIKMQYQSWRSWNASFDSYRTTKSMDKLFNELYHDYLVDDFKQMCQTLADYRNRLNNKRLDWTTIKKKYRSWKLFMKSINPQYSMRTDRIFADLFKDKLIEDVNRECSRICELKVQYDFKQITMKSVEKEYYSWRKWMKDLDWSLASQVEIVYNQNFKEVAA